MNELIYKLIVALIATVPSASCFSLPEAGIGGEYLTITPGGTQIKAVGCKLIFTCTLTSPSSSVQLSFIDERFEMRWKGPASKYITDLKGRVYIERIDDRRLRLYIAEVEERDAGSYSCEADVGGRLLSAHSHLHLFQDIQFSNGSSTKVQQQIRSNVLLECLADGQPEPEISWRFGGRKLISGGLRSAKYVYEKKGLRIYNLTKEDSGVYECRAQVASQGNLKVRLITLSVLYPPEWIAPIQNPLAIRESDVSLECRAEGNPPVTYEWFKELVTSRGVEEQPLHTEEYSLTYDSVDQRGNHISPGQFKIRAVEVADEGRYVCKASNVLGILKAFYDLKVLVAPVITAPRQPPVVEGRTIVLPCEAAGTPPPSIAWRRKGALKNLEENGLAEDENISVNKTSDGINRLIIKNANRKKHNGKYTCFANNSAGIDSKDVEVIIETIPSAHLSSEELIGWKGEQLQVTCFATGHPLPTIAWLHSGLFVSANHVIQIATIRDAENVTSILAINLDDNSDRLFGNYSCVAKNIHGHVTAVFQLRSGLPPDTPRNITVTSETHNSISLSAAIDAPASEAASVLLAPTRWILRYQKTSDAMMPETMINLLYKEGSSIVVGNLDSDTTYTMYLSAANAAGVGPSVKFRAKTLPGPGDFAYNFTGHEKEVGAFQGDDSRSVEEHHQEEAIALEKDMILERGLLADWGGISIGLVIGIAVMLAVLVVTVSGAIIRNQRSVTARRAVMTVVKTKGKSEGGGATSTIKVSECKDIDNLKVETNRPKTAVGPIPGDRFGSLGSRKNFRITQNSAATSATSISNSSSPVLARSGATASPVALGGCKVVGPALDTTMTSAQSQAWQSMLMRAEAEARDEALLQQLEAEAVTDELPHPPIDMLLHSEKSREQIAGEVKNEREKEEEEEEEEEDASGVKEDPLSEDGMSLNSEEECFQKIPQFEGKSFLQY